MIVSGRRIHCNAAGTAAKAEAAIIMLQTSRPSAHESRPSSGT
jgi:hypothetical protein